MLRTGPRTLTHIARHRRRCERLIRWISSSTTAADSQQLYGSVAEHTRQIVLFTGRDYASFQSRFEDQSPLYRALTQRVQDKDGALFGCNIAVTNATLADTGLQASTAPTENSASGESFDAVIYPERIALPFTLTSASVESGRVDDFISNLPRQSLVTSIDSCMQKDRRDLQSTSAVDIYVCTHGARDCRCGEVGTAVYDALVAEARRRHDSTRSNYFRVLRTTHIGGHRFAATCFTSNGDWFGALQPADAPQLLQTLSALPGTTADHAFFWQHWRGRRGLSKDVQIALAQSQLSASSDPIAKPSALDLAQAYSKKRTTPKLLGDAVAIPFVHKDGTVQTITGFQGETVMDAAKRHELVEATCGGFCECATCHVHVRQNESSIAPLPSASDEEQDQIDYALFTDQDSRLACQLPITPSLAQWLNNGGKITLPRF